MCIGTRLNTQLSQNIGGLNFCFWNIHGQTSKLIGDKFRDPDFLQKIEDSHIVGFVELHTENEANLTGFELLKQKIRKKLHKGPKIAGGLSVFIKPGISHMVKVVPNRNNDCIWVKVKKRGTRGKPRCLSCDRVSQP